MLHGAILAALFAYLGSLVLFLFAVRRGAARQLNLSLWLFRAAFLAHLVAGTVLLTRIDEEVVATGGDYYFWLSLFLAVLFLLGGRRVLYPSIGASVAGMVSLFLVSSSLLAHRTGEMHQMSEVGGGGTLLFLHVVPAVIAEALLVFACIGSMLFLIQERRLKMKKLDQLSFNGPSLGALKKLSDRSLKWAFLAMGIAVFSGALWAFGEGKPFLRADPLEWGAIISWLLMGVILQGATNAQWSHRRIAVVTLCAVALFYGCVVFVFISTGNLFHV